MQLRTLAAAAFVLLASGCPAPADVGSPPADMNGIWFGWWSGYDQLGYPLGNGFYLQLTHDRDTKQITGTAWSARGGNGTVSGTTSGSRFRIEVAFAGGSEVLRGREVYGAIKSGEYEGTYGAETVDGDMDMVNAELARTTTDAVAGGVSGRIVTGGTNPVQGATVSIGVGETRQEQVTGVAGTYNFPFVEGGARVVVVSAPTAETAYVPIVVDGATTLPDINLALAATNPTAAPMIALDPGVDGAIIFNSGVLAGGSVTNMDAGSIVASINGNEFVVPLSGVDFDYVLILSRGVNRVVFQATNQAGFTERGAAINAEIAPKRLRATLVWDRGLATGTGNGNDQDLHVWYFPPSGGSYQHAYWSQPEAISSGLLDVDNMLGYGPENFTMDTSVAGRYYIAVNYFAAGTPQGTNDIVRVSLNERTADERVYLFGPQFLTTPGDTYPVTVTNGSWWRVIDVEVDAAGVARLVTTTANPDTSFALPE